jgi:hypothetical protein
VSNTKPETGDAPKKKSKQFHANGKLNWRGKRRSTDADAQRSAAIRHSINERHYAK